MKKTPEKYWHDRLIQKENSLKKSKQYEQESRKRLLEGRYALEEEVKHFIKRYAENDQLTAEEARKQLRGTELREWRYSLREWERMAKAGGYEREMDREYNKSRVSRADALEAHFRRIMSEYAQTESEHLGQFLADSYEDCYYRTIYQVQDNLAQYSSNFSKLNHRQVEQAISENWHGSNFSTRTWDNLTEDLPSILRKSVMRGVVMGYGTDKLVSQVRVVYQNIERYNLHRLINTELAHIMEQATLAGYKESRLIDEYQVLGTLETKTCSLCAKFDLEVFPVNKAVEGKNYPPFHPNCRCTTVPADEFSDDVRAARDPVTGKTIKVPHMKYDDWYEKYVEQPRERELSGEEFGANLDYVRSEEYLAKLQNHSKTAGIADSVARVSRQMLQHRNGTSFEDYYLLDADTGKVVAISNKARKKKGVVYNDQVKNAFKNSAERSLVSIHNHPSGYPPSLSDLASLQQRNKNNSIRYGLTAGHDGSVYWYSRPKKRIPKNVISQYSNQIEKFKKMGYNESVTQEKTLEILSELFDFEFGRID